MPLPTYALDLGNTRLKIGYFEGDTLGRVRVWPRLEEDAALAWLLAQPSAGYALLSGRDDEQRWRRALGAVAPVWTYTPGGRLPVRLYYDTPTTLGVDRLAAVAGAQALYPQTDVMVVSAGTCMTVEHLTAEGDYLGGSISPGVGLRLRAMHEYTGKLPLAPTALPEPNDTQRARGLPLGVSTVTALQQGAIRGAAHELAGWFTAFCQRRAVSTEANVDTSAPRLLLCGGDAALLHPLCPDGAEVREYLVLEGLAQLRSYALK